MITERSIINFLIWTAGLIAGPCLATAAISGNPNPIYTAIALALVAAVFGLARDNMAVAPFIASYCAGRFNMLPLKFSPTDLAVLGLVFYYVIAYLALKRQLMRRGSLFIFVPIMIIGAIIIYNEHNFGIKGIMGSGREGGRKAFFMVAAVAAFLCGISVSGPSLRVLAVTPILCTIGSCIFAIPYILTTYAPSLAPYVYLFSDNINQTAYEADLMDSGEIVRNGGLAIMGTNVLACVLAYSPISSWFRPSRWWLFLLAPACTAGVLVSGFRNDLASFAILVMVSTACYLTWRAIFLLPVVLLGAMLLTVAHTNHILHLPEAAQRTLSFLPGDWDFEVTQNADASTEFRKNIIRVYFDEYGSAHPWFGNGLSYDSAAFEEYTYMARHHETPDGYYESKEFIVSRQFHTGWVSLYDCIGIIGGILFVFLFLALTVQMGRDIFRKSVNRSAVLFPLKVWVFSSLVTQFISFFLFFGDVAFAFSSLCYIAIVWFHVTRIESDHRTSFKVRAIKFDSTRVNVPA